MLKIALFIILATIYLFFVITATRLFNHLKDRIDTPSSSDVDLMQKYKKKIGIICSLKHLVYFLLTGTFVSIIFYIELSQIK